MHRPCALSLALLTAGCLATPATVGPVAVNDAGSPATTATGTGTAQPFSCDVPGGAAPPAVAPNGYYAQGGAVCTATGVQHLFHGVDRPSLEFCPDSTDPDCTHLSAQDFVLMAGWNANVVRVALDQDRWLSTAALYDVNYASTVDQVIQWAEAAGLDVILDLHWSDRGNLMVVSSAEQSAGNSEQQPMADVNSVEFWREVAARYRGDGRVLFELYNEPNSVSWSVWLNGGTYGGYTYAGMQALYDAVRNDAQASNLVIAGGLDWAFDLSRVGTSPIQGYNIMYAAHVYRASDSPSLWNNYFGYLAQQNVAPVIVTEFGDNQSTPNCTGAWDTSVVAYANQWNISWSAWAWYAPSPATLQSLCAFPALISDWSGTPSVQGQAVMAALQAYPARSMMGAADAAVEGSVGAGDDGGDTDGGPSDVATIDSGFADDASADGGLADDAAAQGP